MDKFGLFNLLSALVSPSANDEHIDSAPAPDPQNQTAAPGTDSSSPAAVPSIGVAGIWAAVPIGWALADAAGLGYYLAKRKKLLA